MRKTMTLILLTVLLSVCIVYSDSFSQNMENSVQKESLPVDENSINKEMIKVLIGNLENFFPITSQKEVFTEPKTQVFSDIGKNTLVRTYDEFGARNMELYVNTDGIHDHIAFFPMYKEFPNDFQLMLDVTVNDVFPQDQGGCYVGFTLANASSSSNPGKGETVLLLFNGNESELYVKSSDLDSGTVYHVWTLEKNPVKLSIIHFLEYTYLFIDDNYYGQHHDELSGPFQLMYGSMVLADGETASCSFDNLQVRKVVQ